MHWQKPSNPMAKEEAETFLSYLTDIYPLRPGSVKCHRGHGARSSGCIARLSVCRFWNLILWIFISFDFALIFNYFGPSICRSAFLLHSSDFFFVSFFLIINAESCALATTSLLLRCGCDCLLSVRCLSFIRSVAVAVCFVFPHSLSLHR